MTDSSAAPARDRESSSSRPAGWPPPIAAWEDAARAALPAAARVLVLAASPPSGESAAGGGGQPTSGVERSLVPAGAGAGALAGGLTGAPWDAVVLGPGVLEPATATPVAAAAWAAIRAALAPGGRLAVVAAEGADASAVERLLLEHGSAIRRQEPIEPAAAAPGGALRLFVAGLDGYRVRAAGDGDESAILGLFTRSFHVERSVEHWRWKYRHNPYGNGRISLAFAPDGELVGQYCAYPVRLYRAGQAVIEIQQVGDTMTAQAARSVGRGPTSVLARTAHHFYAAFCRGKVGFNYGFNTGNIQQFGMRFLGVHRVADVPYREAAPVAPPPPRRLLGRLRGSYSVRELVDPAELDRRFDELFEAARDAYGALVERDSRYLGWRYAQRPDLRYRILVVTRGRLVVGWGVFTQREDTLVWGDALFRPEHASAATDLLAAACVGAPDRPGIRRIAGWFPRHPRWWQQTLEGLGFADRPEPQELALGVAPFLDPEAPRWTGESLYYTYGDSDLF